MNVSEQELRAAVRAAIARHVKPDTLSSSTERGPALGHASHILLRLAPGSESTDGSCVIEPAVVCNHCGYCQSFGH
jgi:hypothetical protein